MWTRKCDCEGTQVLTGMESPNGVHKGNWWSCKFCGMRLPEFDLSAGDKKCPAKTNISNLYRVVLKKLKEISPDTHSEELARKALTFTSRSSQEEVEAFVKDYLL